MSDLDNAISPYARYAEISGSTYQQPLPSDSNVVRWAIRLRNSSGFLARYSIKQDRVVA